LAKADKVEADILKAIDKHIAQAGLVVPPETLPQLQDGFAAPLIRQLDLAASGITSVVWAMGYRFDFSWVRLPVLDEDGFPRQQRGVTEIPGLYFLGLPWLHTAKSGLLLGVGADAEYVANHIAGRMSR
jgi:putative flavoprotein involved in K+ transport